MVKEKILIVDDSEMNRSILADMLGDEYEILEAQDGVEGVEILRHHVDEITVVLLDIVMPRMDGFGVLEVMNQNGWIENVPVIMISAENGSAQIARAYDMGVSDFITRPFDTLVVRRRVMNTLLLYAKQKLLIDMVKEQIAETERRSSMMVEILSHIVEFRNGESGLHILNVRTVTDILLRVLSYKTDRYELSEEEISYISVGSALHDIGKIVIDSAILNKPGKLTQEEFAIMKTHAMEGAKMLDMLPEYRNDPLIQAAYEICRWHHERYDGAGYPDGLSGDAIPISAQVVALADVYDALTSPRVYKAPIPHEEAVRMILDGQCGAFNPLLLECLSENAESIRLELSGDSIVNMNRRESMGIVRETVRKGSGNSSTSERTLRLLDHELMKSKSFTDMAGEIQFEYTVAPSMFTFMDQSAKQLGVDKFFPDPASNEQLRAVLGDDGWSQMAEKTRRTTPESPDISYDCQLLCSGSLRWHKVVLKTIWTEDSPPKFHGFLGKAIDIHDTHVKLADLENKAARDSMTGLLNRAAAVEKIDARIAEYPNSQFAMCIFDLDFFKNANDLYGHQFGDQVLKEIARRIVNSVRTSDIACRVGGDEFLLFLEYKTSLEKIIDRIFKSLCGDYKDYTISVTMGVAQSENVEKNYEELFRAADQALYAAKRAGRGRYCFYDDTMQGVFSEISDIDE